MKASETCVSAKGVPVMEFQSHEEATDYIDRKKLVKSTIARHCKDCGNWHLSAISRKKWREPPLAKCDKHHEETLYATEEEASAKAVDLAYSRGLMNNYKLIPRQCDGCGMWDLLPEMTVTRPISIWRCSYCDMPSYSTKEEAYAAAGSTPPKSGYIPMREKEDAATVYLCPNGEGWHIKGEV